VIDIKPLHTSFLDINPNDATYKDVEYILLDPSCSGSGIVRRLDHLVSKTGMKLRKCTSKTKLNL
jgi:25S rRNA (cytosine2278-C5)-methyltransferase